VFLKLCTGWRDKGRTMRVTILLLAAAVADAVNASVKHEDVTVGGYVCGEHQTARVYYPGTSGKFPLISFAHGYNCPGKQAYSCYSRLNTAVAAAGYVVVVLEATKWPLECANEWKDQVRSIEWAKTSKIASRIDFTKKVGILGHSMGGGATYHTAGQASAVKDQNIGAAVALHPQTAPLQPISNSLVPIFFGTGSRDSVVSPGSVKSAYSKTSGVAKVFAEISGANHFEPMTSPPGPNRHTPYAIAMFDCHLKGNKAQCGKVYTKSRGALCSGKVKMTDCEHASEPSSEVVVV